MEDPVYLSDDKVLDKMLASEERQVLTRSYFDPKFETPFAAKSSQFCAPDAAPPLDFTEADRATLVGWMRDVCEDRGDQPDILPLSVWLVDKFLSEFRIRKYQLQLLGAVCLLLASKIRQTKHIPVSDLTYYSRDSLHPQEILSWEILVLSTLKWDLSFVTPVDYLDIFIRKLTLDGDMSVRSEIENEALQMIAGCCLDFRNAFVRPSVIAWVCLRRAMKRHKLSESCVRLAGGRRIYPENSSAVPTARLCCADA